MPLAKLKKTMRTEIPSIRNKRIAITIDYVDIKR